MSRVIVTPDAPGSRLVCEGLQPQRRAGGDPNRLWPLISQPISQPSHLATPASSQSPRITHYRGAYAVLLTSMWLGLPPRPRCVAAVTRGYTRGRWATSGSNAKTLLRQLPRRHSGKWLSLAFARLRCSSSSTPSRHSTLASSRTSTGTRFRCTSWTRQLLPLSRPWRSSRCPVTARAVPATSTNSGTR
jgi:hypothetical protein